MPGRVDVDVVPSLVRPAEVEKALAEAIELRTRSRQAQEQVAAAQAALDELKRQDVEAAARAARAGEALGSTPAAVKKARDQLEAAKRIGAALALALEGAEADLAATLGANADGWITALDAERELARERGLAAIAAVEDAARTLGATASVTTWLRSGQSDSRFDRRPEAMVAGTSAPGSKRATANGEALKVDALVGYCRELFDETPVPHLAQASSAA